MSGEDCMQISLASPTGTTKKTFFPGLIILLYPPNSQHRKLDMNISNWELKTDHCRISMELVLSEISISGTTSPGKPWSIPQPELRNLSEEQKQKCKTLTEENLAPTKI